MENDTSSKTLLEAARYFADPDVAHEFTVRMVYPDGVFCTHCGTVRTPYSIRSRNRRLFRCKDCGKDFTVKVGTIFEDSPLGLDKWLVAIWQIANCKNGISSYELSRALGVTQKTAWFMLHRIRLAMRTGSFKKLAGFVEADETFIGGKESNKHESKKLKQGRGAVGKAVVAGLLERGGGVRAKVVPNTSSATLHQNVRENVYAGSALFTDAHAGYQGLGAEYVHAVVDHAVEYVREHVIHTNSLENFWSLLKRSIKGTYVSVDIAHLDAYLDEQAFRFNERKGNDTARFEKTLSSVVGKRLTYKELIGSLSQ